MGQSDLESQRNASSRAEADADVSVRQLNVPYFIEGTGFRSTLVLENRSARELTASVTVYSRYGEPLQEPRVQVQRGQVEKISLSQFFSKSSLDCAFGNVHIAFSEDATGVSAYVAVTLNDHPCFESAGTPVVKSRFLEAAVMLPNHRSLAGLALTNIGRKGINVTIRSKLDTHAEKALGIENRQTRLVDLRPLLRFRKGEPVSAIVLLEHDGDPGDLIATGFVLSSGAEYAASVDFRNPSQSRESA